MDFSSNCAGYCGCFQLLQMIKCRKKTQRIRKHLLQQQTISLNLIQKTSYNMRIKKISLILKKY